MLGTLFAFGALGFWALLLVSFVALMVCIQFERYGIAFFTVLATLGLLYFFGNSGIFPWITEHPLQILLGVLGYVVAGTAWSLGKWFLFVVDRKEKLLEFKAEWTRLNPEDDFKIYFNSKHTTWDETTHKQISIKEHYGIPEPRNHKKRILGWMGWWPWSLLNALLFDFFRRVFQHIYNALAGVFRSIAKKVYGDVLDDVLEK